MRRAAMSIRSFAAIAALLGVAFAMQGDKAEAKWPAMSLALTDVNVVDVKRGEIVPRRTVIIAGGSIVAIQNASDPLRPGTKVVPSRGKYLLPGLWDMHVHVADEGYLDLFVANGVTGVRDMGGDLDRPGDGCGSLKPSILHRWRSNVAAGRKTGPELIISGPAVSGTGSLTSLSARTPAEAVAAVKTLKRQRVDFLKVYDRIPLATYKTLAAEAKRIGLPFVGHVPDEVGLLNAIRTGQRSIEHIRDPLLVCFTQDETELDRFFAEDGWSDDDKKWGRAAHAACPEIIAELQKNEVWLTPTLTVEKSKVSVEDADPVNDRRRRFLPQSVRDGYSAYMKGKLAQSARDRASEHLWWRTQQKLVQRMSQAGVKLLAGTDSACEGGLPGYSLHGELSELVATGLSPLAALKTATVEPARYFGRDKEGEVRVGYRANLLLLDANPLSDIANTRLIHGVMVDGKLYPRTDLDQLIRRPR